MEPDSGGMRRLLLVRHAGSTAAERRAYAFPASSAPRRTPCGGPPPSCRSRRAARWCAARRSVAEATAEAAGLEGRIHGAGHRRVRLRVVVRPHSGGARGRAARRDAALDDRSRQRAAWRREPAGVRCRVFAWLDGQARRDGTCVAITHGGVVKAAVLHALGAPSKSFWRVDCAPLSRTELHAHDGRWT